MAPSRQEQSYCFCKILSDPPQYPAQARGTTVCLFGAIVLNAASLFRDVCPLLGRYLLLRRRTLLASRSPPSGNTNALGLFVWIACATGIGDATRILLTGHQRSNSLHPLSDIIEDN